MSIRWVGLTLFLFFLFMGIRISQAQSGYQSPDMMKKKGKELMLKYGEEYYRGAILKGKGHFFSGEFREADSILRLPLINRIKISDSVLYFSLFRYLGKVNIHLNKHETSLEYFHKALKYFENREDFENTCYVYVDLIDFHRAVANFKLAWGFVKRYRTLQKKFTPGDRLKAYYYHRLAALFHEDTHNTDSVLFYSQKSIAISIENNFPNFLATSYNEVGYVLMANGNQRGMQYFRKSEHIYEENGYHRYLINVKNNIVRFYVSEGKTDSALIKLKEAEELSKQYDWNEILVDIYNLVGDLNFESGNYQEAYRYLKKSYEFREKYLERLYNGKLSEISYQYEKARNRQDLLEKEKRLQTMRDEAERRELRIWSVLSLTIALLISLLIAGYFIYRIRKKNRILNDHRLTITKINSELKLALDEKTMLFQELHHRVKNNLSVLSSLLFLEEEQVQNSDAKEILVKSRQRIQTMGLIHQSLYNVENASSIEFQRYFSKLIESVSLSYGRVGLQVRHVIQCEDLILEVSPAVSLAMALNELITNSFKYAFKDRETGEIRITHTRRDGDLHIIEYSDDGPGLPPGIDVTDAKTLGLKLVYLMTRNLNGELEYIRATNTFIIRFQDHEQTD